jgi:hypothetical protein
MKQTNLSTQFSRAVRRVITDSTTELPPHWTPQKVGPRKQPELCTLVDVPRSSGEWADVDTRLHKTLPKAQVRQTLSWSRSWANSSLL